MDLTQDRWTQLFANDTPVVELMARGTLVYLAILVLMRFMPRRAGGELALMDLIFVVLVADAGAHALGHYDSVTDAVIMIATIMGWDYLLNWLSFHVPFVERLLAPPPLLIVKNGEMLRRNMRRELITQQELMDHLRQRGVDSLEKVKAAYVESEGKLSVICR